MLTSKEGFERCIYLLETQDMTSNARLATIYLKFCGVRLYSVIVEGIETQFLHFLDTKTKPLPCLEKRSKLLKSTRGSIFHGKSIRVPTLVVAGTAAMSTGATSAHASWLVLASWHHADGGPFLHINAKAKHLEDRCSVAEPWICSPQFVTLHTPQINCNHAPRHCQAREMPISAPLYRFGGAHGWCPRNLRYRRSSAGSVSWTCKAPMKNET